MHQRDHVSVLPSLKSLPKVEISELCDEVKKLRGNESSCQQMCLGKCQGIPAAKMPAHGEICT